MSELGSAQVLQLGEARLFAVQVREKLRVAVCQLGPFTLKGAHLEPAGATTGSGECQFGEVILSFFDKSHKGTVSIMGALLFHPGTCSNQLISYGILASGYGQIEGTLAEVGQLVLVRINVALVLNQGLHRFLTIANMLATTPNCCQQWGRADLVALVRVSACV